MFINEFFGAFYEKARTVEEFEAVEQWEIDMANAAAIGDQAFDEFVADYDNSIYELDVESPEGYEDFLDWLAGWI